MYPLAIEIQGGGLLPAHLNSAAVVGMQGGQAAKHTNNQQEATVNYLPATPLASILFQLPSPAYLAGNHIYSMSFLPAPLI